MYYIKITEEKNNETSIEAFQEVRKKYPGEIPILLFYADTGKKVLFESDRGFAESLELELALLEIFGVGNIILQ